MVALTSIPARDVCASSLFAAGRDATLTDRLPSLAILCESIFSCAIPNTSRARTFGFTFQKEVSLDVG